MSTWIFGYGSLIWRPAFAYEERHAGTVSGWTRRFWQGSTDHRGVPGAPGRVVTLVPEPGAACWGVAYRVAPREREAVLARLDHREQGGYARHDVRFRFAGGGREVDALVYVATPGNPNYLGPAPLPEIVRQVRASHGPSGPNPEYVLCLADALREMGAEDDHVFALAELLSPVGALRPRSLLCNCSPAACGGLAPLASSAHALTPGAGAPGGGGDGSHPRTPPGSTERA